MGTLFTKITIQIQPGHFMKRLKAKGSRLTGTILKLSLLIVIAISAGACQTRQNGNSPSGESLGKSPMKPILLITIQPIHGKMSVCRISTVKD